jgi:VWFA-related protein
LLTLSVVVVVAAGGLPSAQQTFRGRVDAVLVEVSVLRGHGPVGGLAAADFLLTDNGVPQQVELRASDQVPLQLTLLVDMSTSMVDEGVTEAIVRRDTKRRPNPEWLEAAVPSVMATLRQGDVFHLVNFATSARTAPERPDGALSLMTPGEGPESARTALLDAIDLLLMEPPEPGFRKLIIVLTDARDTASIIPLRLQDSLGRRSSAVVDVIAVGDPDLRMGGGTTNQYDLILRDLARSSGGEIYLSDAGGDFARTLASALTAFRAGYVLAFTPTGVTASGWHTLRVGVLGHPDYDVRARRGYWR